MILNNSVDLTDEMENIVATSGDLYIWVCEIDNNSNPKIVVNAQKIDRIKELPLGSRMTSFFFDNETSTFCYEMVGNENRKNNIKIGTITDKTILKAIKNGESDSLQKLLNYSKSANSIYTGNITIGKSNSITNSLNLKDGEYYQSDLIGFDVVRDGKKIGIVDGFQNFGGGDIIELDNDEMVSFRGATVDIKNKTIMVK